MTDMSRGFTSWKRDNNKYYAHKVVFKGIEFDSGYERDRYVYLLHQQRHGRISGLRLQQMFVIIPQLTKTVPVQLKTKVRYDRKVVEQGSVYTCDFVYKENGMYVMEEVKGEATSKLADYVLRRKLMMRKIYGHNAKGHGQWIFREVIHSVGKNKTVTITDK